MKLRSNCFIHFCLRRSVAMGVVVLVIFTGAWRCAYGQTEIVVDGSSLDWSNVPVAYDSPPGTGAPGQIDFGQLKIANDQDFVFFRVELGKNIIIQENNNLQLLIDTDLNSSTGLAMGGIGADLVWRFGQRQGTVYRNGTMTVEHPDVKLRTSPTFSSSVYEIAIGRNIQFSGQPLFSSSTIRVILRDGTSGDRIPINGILQYTIQAGTIPAEPASFARLDPNDLRVLSWNVKQDGLWNQTQSPRFGRILQAVQPDIICFQEIYSHSTANTVSLVQQFLPGTWNSRANNDCKSLSRLSILGSWAVPGSSIMLVNTIAKFGKPTVIVNSHLACCENNASRENQIDSLLAFIRNAKQGGGSPTLQADTPIAIMGDLNLVTNGNQHSALLHGNIFDSSTHGPSFSPDWDGTPFRNLYTRHSDSREGYSWRSDTSDFSPGILDYQIYSDAVLEVANHFLVNTEAMSSSRLASLGLQWNDSWASDHMAFVVDYRLPTKQPAYATVQGSFLFHNEWTGVPANGLEDAIDGSKALVKESSTPHTMDLNNLINTSHGINGIGFDIEGLWNAQGLSANDFQFQVSPQGPFSIGFYPPTSWVNAPAPISVTVDGGDTSRVLVRWGNYSIENRWLRITVLANENTGLEAPEVYYIGHLRGETTGPENGFLGISFADISAIREAVGQTVGPDGFYDIDKNGSVSFGDISAMRSNVGTQLTNVTVP